MTATWDTFYVDYETAGLLTGVPAHVVAQQALGIEDPMEAKAALIDALQRRFEDPTDIDDVKAIAETYNTYFDHTSLPDDPGIYAGYGPYNLVDFTEDGTMTFEAREDYTWGPRPQCRRSSTRSSATPRLPCRRWRTKRSTSSSRRRPPTS